MWTVMVPETPRNPLFVLLFDTEKDRTKFNLISRRDSCMDRVHDYPWI